MRHRRSSARGLADHGWLKSFHTFSFAGYHDPAHMGFRTLRVLNDDRVAPGKGFGPHGHQNMEIVSYVLEGALEHKDSIGNGSVMRPGDVQRMSAGTGVRHSEFNGSQTEGVHFLQIWILPDRPGHVPGYEQIHVDEGAKRGRLKLIASPNGAEGSLTLHQDARIYAGRFDGVESAEHTISRGRAAWIHVACGTVHVNGARMIEGDAVSIDPGAGDAPLVVINQGANAEVLLLNLK
ncbi:MAG: pirin family protein [Myxococcales bacterium]|nr:pirin family protein [Myxococcales bacterium]